MSNVTLEALVVYCSDDGRTGWHPIRHAEVPAWVKAPDVMARLADGEECMDCAQGVAGSKWYRAIPVSQLLAMSAVTLEAMLP